MAKIDLEKLTKDFGSFRAVDDLDLEIVDGEFIVFVGPSGCGKTTTLNMISGFEQPTAGSVKIDGTVVNDNGARGAGPRDGLPEPRSVPPYERV